MTAVMPDRVIDRGLATTRWKTEKRGSFEQKGHDRDFALQAEPKRRRQAAQLQVNLRELGIPGQRVSLARLRQLAAQLLEEPAEPPSQEEDPSDERDWQEFLSGSVIDDDDPSYDWKQEAAAYGLTPQQLLGFDLVGPARRPSFIDIDDDEHELLGSLGMHIIRIPS